MQLLIKTVCENANVFDVTSHSLRKTFITVLSNKMISAREIQKLVVIQTYQLHSYTLRQMKNSYSML